MGSTKLEKSRVERSTLHAVEAALEEAILLQQRAEAKCAQSIAEVAHDIKNPLTAMIGYIRLMRYESQELADAKDPAVFDRHCGYLKVLDSSSMRLLSLCESLLGMNGAPEEGAKPVTHVGALTDEIMDLFAVQAKERGVHLESEVPVDFPDVSVDPKEMFRVLSNLVSNAIKFTNEGGKVKIVAEVDEFDNAFVMVVRDSGVGMTLEQINNVLDQTRHTTVSPHGDVGTGYGLGIVNRIVREMGGQMEIISSENRGTKVRIKFPGDLLISSS